MTALGVAIVLMVLFFLLFAQGAARLEERQGKSSRKTAQDGLEGGKTTCTIIHFRGQKGQDGPSRALSRARPIGPRR